MRTIAAKHSRIIRWTHWINFPLLALMIWSGILIYWANPVYRIGAGGLTLIKMNVSQPSWQKVHVDHRLAEGMSLHFFFMWFFAINGLLYVTYALVSGEWRELVPRRGSVRHAYHTVLHDLRLRKDPPPPRKFNGAQQFAYTMVIVMAAGSLLSGLAIYKPVQLWWLTATFGGYQAARFVHFWLTVGYIAFFFVHLAQVFRAGWNNFRSMVTGLEIVETAGEHHE